MFAIILLVIALVVVAYICKTNRKTSRGRQPKNYNSVDTYNKYIESLIKSNIPVSGVKATKGIVKVGDILEADESYYQWAGDTELHFSKQSHYKIVSISKSGVNLQPLDPNKSDSSNDIKFVSFDELERDRYLLV